MHTKMGACEDPLVEKNDGRAQGYPYPVIRSASILFAFQRWKN